MGALSSLCNRETNREPSYQAPPLVAWNTLSHLSILVTAPVHILPTLPASVSTHDLHLHTEGVHVFTAAVHISFHRLQSVYISAAVHILLPPCD